MIARTLAGWGRMLGLTRSPDAKEDRRVWGRISCNVSTTCRTTRVRGAEEIPIRFRNVSLGGACLHIPVPLPPGELLRLALPSAGGELDEILACVVRCDAGKEGGWDIGCTFATPLTGQDLQFFEALPCPNPAPADRREWDRFPCPAHAKYQLVRAGDSAEFLNATILNISGGGIALCPEHPFEVGELLSIDLYREEELVITALASAVRAQREDGRLILGCNFIRELSEIHLTRLLA